MKTCWFAVVDLFVIKENVTLECDMQVYGNLTGNHVQYETNREATTI
jgi:hypothetical protein